MMYIYWISLALENFENTWVDKNVFSAILSILQATDHEHFLKL